MQLAVTETVCLSVGYLGRLTIVLILNYNITAALLSRFSRRITWIHVASTNNDPKVIAGYFVDCVKGIGGICA